MCKWCHKRTAYPTKRSWVPLQPSHCVLDSPKDSIPPSPSTRSHTPTPRAIVTATTTTHTGQTPTTVTSYMLCFMGFCESATLTKPGSIPDSSQLTTGKLEASCLASLNFSFFLFCESLSFMVMLKNKR